MKYKISPSMMCANFLDLKNQILSFEKANIDMLHIDIMDGAFVPNITLGVDFCNQLKSATKIPLDFHLMVERPEEKINYFDFKKNDSVSIHYESTYHVQRVLQKLKSMEVNVGLALCPATPINVLENVMDVLDFVLIMTVNPGYAGQDLILSCVEKIQNTRNYLDSHGYKNVEIEVDGCVRLNNIKEMQNKGANIFVGGSVLFNNGDILQNVSELRKKLETKE
ncbi:MAG: ribulose-phosphate 3-epimerase [Eubacteriales bacterium]|nr:ribulose-phosphate 3-epimerase [Eubacteriales bacterium]